MTASKTSSQTALQFEQIIEGLADGSVVPYLGPGVLDGVVDLESGKPMPAHSDDLILAMNRGQPMAPRLMWEFPRAAMHVELKRGRSAVTRFLQATYGETDWTRSPLHDWLSDIAAPYVIDINRDTQLQDSYGDRPHLLVRGVARIAGSDYRYRLDAYDGREYREITDSQVDERLPVLFKAMGSPVPDPLFIASDADYVDFITELMGGFAIPQQLKRYRRKRHYLFLGLRLQRDTERMVLSDMVYDAGKPTGWALIRTPSTKERRFCAHRGIEIIEADWPQLLCAAGVDSVTRDGETALVEAASN